MYASSERIAWHLVLLKSFVDLSNDGLSDWAMKHLPSQRISVIPEDDATFTENQKDIFSEITADIMVGCYENGEKTEKHDSDYMHPEEILSKFDIPEAKVLATVQWCIDNIKYESTVFGLMWSLEMMASHHSWSRWNDKSSRNSRCWDTMAGLIRFCKGDKYGEFLYGGNYIDLKSPDWHV